MLIVEKLCKSYNSTRALNSISFNVNQGETVGFIGVNGSGKTTTMRSIMGLISFETGSISIDNVQQDARRTFVRKLGYMPEERGLYPNQRIKSQLEYFGQLQGMTKGSVRKRIEELLTDFNLQDKMNYRLGDLSLGNQQRIQLVVSMLHNPKYLVLDEPFSGLDPVGVQDLLNLLQDKKDSGVGILFSSHVLPYIEKICDRVIIIDKGEIIADKSLSQLVAVNVNQYKLRSTTNLPGDWLQNLPVREVSRDSNNVTVEFSGKTNDRLFNEILQQAMRHGSVLEFVEVRKSLDEYYGELISQHGE